MKKTTTILAALLLASGALFAQIDPVCTIAGATLCDDFEAYTPGDALGPGASWWTTWSGVEGGAEDGEISDLYAYSGSNSMTIEEGGINDVLLLLGNQSSGNWRLEWQMYIPDGKTGYFNIQQSETPGIAWNMEVLFGLSAIGVPSSSGEGTMTVPTLDDFTYPVDTWFKVEMLIDLDANVFDIYIDEVLASSGAFTGNIGAVDFYSVDGNCRYYVDDVLFTDATTIAVTYQVDITPYLDGGAVISGDGIRIGGNFSDNGASLPNWTPSDPACAMTDLGDNIWEITVEYPSVSAGLTQQFKYVNGDWFPTGENEYDDGAPSLFGELGCGGDNREVTIPESDATFLFCWEECAACVVEMECNPPTGLEVSDLSATSATVSLDAVGPADQYVLAIRNNTTGERNSRQVSGTSYTFTGLNPGHSYTFRTKSVCYPDGISGPSVSVDFSTPLRLGDVRPGMAVYPNPGNGSLFLQGWSAGNEQATLSITTITGAQVLQLVLDAAAMSDPMPLQLDVAPGMYLLHVQGDAGAYHETIIIE